jgi:BirA family transcriptional regulator, biotin operon repressor / biotin---[acetyl-CoA-carboxylase] ligase
MTSPALPPDYELFTYDRIDSAVGEAQRLAAKGADEGTLVWTQEQIAGHGRFGRAWVSPPGNLYCALILRLEEPVALIAQLNYVAAVALASTLADLMGPTELRYRWPNDLLLYDRKVAGILLDPGPRKADAREWLVLGVAVNVISAPEELNDVYAASMHAQGASTASAADVLEGFSRYFLSGINRWANEGFAPVRKAWVQRVNGLGESVHVALQHETLNGRFAEVDDEGAMVMELPDRRARKITVAEFFSI